MESVYFRCEWDPAGRAVASGLLQAPVQPAPRGFCILSQWLIDGVCKTCQPCWHSRALGAWGRAGRVGGAPAPGPARGRVPAQPVFAEHARV